MSFSILFLLMFMFLYLISNFFRHYIVYSYFFIQADNLCFQNVFRLFTFNLNIDGLIFSLTLLHIFFPFIPFVFYFFLSLFLSPLVLLVFLWLHWIFFGFSLAITIAYFILVAALKNYGIHTCIFKLPQCTFKW